MMRMRRCFDDKDIVGRKQTEIMMMMMTDYDSDNDDNDDDGDDDVDKDMVGRKWTAIRLSV